MKQEGNMLTAGEGLWLTQRPTPVYCVKEAWLGANDTPDNWQEVDDDARIAIEGGESAPADGD